MIEHNTRCFAKSLVLSDNLIQQSVNDICIQEHLRILSRWAHQHQKRVIAQSTGDGCELQAIQYIGCDAAQNTSLSGYMSRQDIISKIMG